jgi:transposase
LLDRWCAWAQRSRIPAFVKLGRTIGKHRGGILAAIRLGLSNGCVEGLNNKIRLIIRRAFGLHSAKAAAAMVMLCCDPSGCCSHMRNNPTATYKSCNGPEKS